MAKKTTPPYKKTPATKTGAPAKAVTAAKETSASSGWLPYALVVLAITALCYLPSLKNALVNWDDDPNITENPNLERVEQEGAFSTIGAIFDLEKGNVIGNYNPLPILTFAIEKAMAGGINTTLIHTTNLILHLLTVFFVMRLLLGMGIGRWGMAAGGLLFGIHPMRVESVAWATERKDVLFAVFFFAALVYYVKWLKSEDQSKRTEYYLWMVVLAVLSCFSKVQAVTLPLSMLALDYWFRRPLSFKLILEKIPFWALSLTFGLINIYTLKLQGSTDDAYFTFLDRLCIGAYSFCVYLYKLILPYPMSPLYPYAKPVPTIIYLSPIAFFAIWYLVYLAWKKNYRTWVFGILFFFFNVMFLLQVLGAGQGFLADRFTYVPYFGFFTIAAWYYDRAMADAAMKSTLQGALGILTVIYGIWTVRQVAIWKNGDTLWSHVMKYEKETSSLPYWNRGQYRRNVLGIYDAALQDYTKAVQIDPKNPELYNSRGKTYFDMAMSGKYPPAQTADYRKKALEDYSNALQIGTLKPKTQAEILINSGAAYGSQGDYLSALKSINRGLKVDPGNKNGYFNRSIVYYTINQPDSALADYRTYLQYDPNNHNIWYESGMLLRTQNKNAESIESLTRCLRLKPDYGLAYLERARAYAQSGNKVAAQQDYQRARELKMQTTAFDAQLMGQ